MQIYPFSGFELITHTHTLIASMEEGVNYYCMYCFIAESISVASPSIQHTHTHAHIPISIKNERDLLGKWADSLAANARQTKRQSGTHFQENILFRTDRNCAEWHRQRHRSFVCSPTSMVGGKQQTTAIRKALPCHSWTNFP